MYSTTLRRMAAPALTALLLMALPAASLAAVPASTPLIGSFPIGGIFAPLEPESTFCGFEITAESAGEATFRVFFDEAGEPSRVHVHAMWTGTLSANGITLRGRSSLNQFFDFTKSTAIEVGIVFQNAAAGIGVVLMDRGRLVWSVDPETGQWIFPPAFEAGPHPQLHGDMAALCEALSA